MKSRQQATAERPPAKRRGPKPSISDEARLVAIEADLEASPWAGRGTPRRSGLGFGVCRGIRVSRGKRVLRVMRENNLLSPQSLPPRRQEIPMSVRSSSHAPNLMWGTDGVRVFTDWTTAGAGYSPPSSIGTPSTVSAGMCASEATASPPFSRSPWGLRGCMLSTSAGAARGLALRMDRRLPVSVGPLHQPDHEFRASSRPTPSSNSPRPGVWTRGSIARSRNRSSMAASTATGAELRNAVANGFARTVQSSQWIVEKNGYLSPAQARQAHTAMSSGGAA